MMINKNIIRIAIITLSILSLPLIAMQFTNEVYWGLFDFIIIGILIFGTGLAYQLMTRKLEDASYKIGTGIAVGTSLLLIWINLAVGIIGNENNPANFTYIGVLIIETVGIFISNFKPPRIMYVLLLTAIAQVSVPIIALIIWKPQITPDVFKVFGVNMIFVALWIISALFFKHASIKNTNQ